MSKKSYIIFFLVFGFVFLFLPSNSYAIIQKWNSLDYDVTVNEDGSMDVVETWNIYMNGTNTLFKTFDIDKSKYSSIEDVEVIEIAPERKELTQIYEQQYHVDTDCFYALKIDSKTFEIAWNVGLDYGFEDRIYEVHYKVNDVVKVYKDCTELYWMFLSDKNEIPGRNITGTIKLPNKVDDLDTLRVWGHGSLPAVIQKESNDTIVFNSDSITENSMLEVRVVTEENIYPQITNKKGINKLKSILSEEKRWAFRTNFKSIFPIIFIIVSACISIFLIIFYFTKILKYIREGKELVQEYSRNKIDLKYFRDIPNEKDATPGRAAYLYYMKDNVSNISSHIPNVVSAIMLDFALKDYIKFEPIDKKNMKIVINKSADKELLSEEECEIFKILINACGSMSSITTEEFKEYCQENYETVYKNMNGIKRIINDELEKINVIDAERKKISDYYKNKSFNYLSFSFFGMAFVVLLVLFPLLIELIICAFICSSNAKKVSILSEKGEEEKAQWKALKNYMNDFSLLKEKEVPDLILWEKYLVYATAFGISKKVVKDLKVVYPEIINSNYYNDTSCHYIHYLCDSRFENDFVTSFNSAISSAYSSASSAYSSAHYSSGSGGGRRFLWWWRRPEAAVAGCGGR